MRVAHIQAAYNEARRQQRPKPPPWEELSGELREAIIRVYFAGRLDLLHEREQEQAKRAWQVWRRR